MKRLRVRLHLLKALRLALGAILFSALWAVLGGKQTWVGYVFLFGVLGFFVSVIWMVDECNVAIEAVNIRVDDGLIRGDRRDARLAAIERRLGLDFFDDDDTPPRSIPTFDPKGGVR